MDSIPPAWSPDPSTRPGRSSTVKTNDLTICPICIPDVSPRKPEAMISAMNGCTRSFVIRMISATIATSASTSRNASLLIPNMTPPCACGFQGLPDETRVAL